MVTAARTALVANYISLNTYVAADVDDGVGIRIYTLYICNQRIDMIDQNGDSNKYSGGGELDSGGNVSSGRDGEDSVSVGIYSGGCTSSGGNVTVKAGLTCGRRGRA